MCANVFKFCIFVGILLFVSELWTSTKKLGNQLPVENHFVLKHEFGLSRKLRNVN